MTKQIPFIDLQTQYQAYKKDIDAGIQDVLDKSQYIMGPAISELETGLTRFLDNPTAESIACSSGTDALLLALMAYDIGPGDEVITTPFTFIATVEVISFLGATPVFVDITEDDYNIDVTQLEAAITPNTKAIMPVSLYGQVADMDEINAIAAKHNIPVIEDAAQSFGATYKGKRSCTLSEIGCTSFFPAKPLGCYGDGGLIVINNNPELAKKIRALMVHGQTDRYVHPLIGINARMDTIQAAVLNAKLSHYQDEIDKRQAIGKTYTDALADIVTTPSIQPGRDSVYAQYSIQVENRDAFQATLKAAGIPTAVHYPVPVHMQEAYHHLGHSADSFPVAKKVSEHIVSLPMSPFLSAEDQTHIIQTIQKYNEKQSA